MKILSALLGTTLFFGLSMVVFAETVIRQKLFDGISGKGVFMARRVAADCVDPILTEKLFEIEMMFKDMLSSEEDLSYIFVMNKDGRVLAHSFAGGFPDGLRAAHEVDPLQPYSAKELKTDRGDVLDLGVPLYGGEVGFLRMGISEDSINREVNGIVLLVVSFSLFVIMGGGMVATLLSGVITRPLMRLSAASAAFGRGEPVRDVKITSGDEIGELARIFNAMVERRIRSEGEREGLIVELMKEIASREAAEDQLRRSLKEKEVLLSEVHHRVKNNMAVISSLLSLESRFLADEKYQNVFRESKSRIKTMALIHEKLYRSSDFTHIDVKDYIESLVHNVMKTFMTSIRVRVNTEVENINLDIDTLIPCGLLINELLTNAFKYAFSGHDSPELAVTLRDMGDGNALLTVADNGKGLPEGFDFSEESTGLGLNIVRDLCRQIKGRIEVTSQGGTIFAITFPIKHGGEKQPHP